MDGTATAEIEAPEGTQPGQTQDAGSAAPLTATPTWRDSLPAGLREHKSLERYKDAGALASAYVALESKLGTPLAAPGADAKPEDVARWRKALGVPDTAEGYDLGQPMVGETAIPSANLDHFRGLFHKAGVPPGAAKQIVDGYAGWVAQQQATVRAQNREGLDKLRTEWGDPLWQRRKALAETAYAAYVPEALRTEMTRMGLQDHPGLFQVFATIGEQLAEAEYITGDVPGQGSKADAEAELAALHASKEYRAGDPKALARNEALLKRIYGVKEG